MKQATERKDFEELVDASLLSLISQGLVRVVNINGKDMFGLTPEGLEYAKKRRHNLCPRCGEPTWKPTHKKIDGKMRPVLYCQSCRYTRELRG